MSDFWNRVNRAVFVITIAVLAALMILGTLLPQDQPLEHYRAFVPRLAPLIVFLQLHSVYGSPVFLLLLGLLAVQLVLRAVQAAVRRGGQFASYKESGAAALMYAGAACIAAALLISNSPWSFSGQIKLAEGSCAAVPEVSSPELSIELLSLDIPTDAEHRPQDYISRFLVRESDGRITELSSSVNHPARYRGLDFYQSGCGSAAVEIICQNQHRRQSSEVFLQGLPETPLIEFSLCPRYRYLLHRFYPHAVWKDGKIISNSSVPGSGAALILEIDLGEQPTDASSSPAIFNYRRLGWITPDKSVKTSAGAHLILGRQYKFSIIRYKRDRGYPCLLLGFAFLLSGLILYYYNSLKEELSWKP